ncbi:MAG: hypothetical protein ACREIF_16030 [Chthoniobacterales bacterium]
MSQAFETTVSWKDSFGSNLLGRANEDRGRRALRQAMEQTKTKVARRVQPAAVCERSSAARIRGQGSINGLHATTEKLISISRSRVVYAIATKFLIQPGGYTSMPNASTHYVTWISRGKRGHGSAYTDIGPQSNSNLQTGDTFQPAWAPPSFPWEDGSATFAFWSIAGGANGGVVDFNQLAQGVPVGSNNIVATAIYIAGGGGNGEPGVSIDAFDVNQGIFVDDDFVSVSPDASLTAAANNAGWVPSASAESVIAFNSIHAVPFSEWHVFLGTEMVNNTTLNVAVKTSAVAFAFYKTPVSSGPPTTGRNYALETWVSYGVMVDGGGPTGAGPVDPWGPYVRDFAAGLMLADAAKKVDAGLKGQVMALAAKQVSIAAAAIQKNMAAFAKTQNR